MVLKLILSSLILASGPSPVSVASPTLAATADVGTDSVSMTWRRVSGNANYAGISAVIPTEARRIRFVGEWRGEWGHATIGTPGFKRGNRIDTRGDHLRIAGTFRLASQDRTVTLAWATCEAEDMNGDGVVGGSDLAEVLARWGRQDAFADVNRDGTVNGADLSAVIGAWGNG